MFNTLLIAGQIMFDLNSYVFPCCSMSCEPFYSTGFFFPSKSFNKDGFEKLTLSRERPVVICPSNSCNSRRELFWDGIFKETKGIDLKEWPFISLVHFLLIHKSLPSRLVVDEVLERSISKCGLCKLVLLTFDRVISFVKAAAFRWDWRCFAQARAETSTYNLDSFLLSLVFALVKPSPQKHPGHQKPGRPRSTFLSPARSARTKRCYGSNWRRRTGRRRHRRRRRRRRRSERSFRHRLVGASETTVLFLSTCHYVQPVRKTHLASNGVFLQFSWSETIHCLDLQGDADEKAGVSCSASSELPQCQIKTGRRMKMFQLPTGTEELRNNFPNMKNIGNRV